MEIQNIEGIDRGVIMLYALSTCVWCKKTKRLLNELGVSYSYVDVDLLDDEKRVRSKKRLNAGIHSALSPPW